MYCRLQTQRQKARQDCETRHSVAVWHHCECVGISDCDQIGCWPYIEADMKQVRDIVTSTLETANATMRQLAHENHILEDQIQRRTCENERLLDDNIQLRQRLTQLSAENDSLRRKQFAQNMKTLLIGDSLLRDIDEGKLKATDVYTISGGRLTNVLTTHVLTTLANGAANDGYLKKGGLRLTVSGTNRLANNLKLSITDDILDVTRTRRHATKSDSDDRHDERYAVFVVTRATRQCVVLL